MKYLLNTILICTFLTFFSAITFSQNWGNGENGKGEVVSKELNLKNFTGIDLGISGDVVLTKGQTQKVRVEGQQNIIDLLKTDISNNTWKIGFAKNVRNHKTIKIYITIPTLTKIGVSGSGNINSTNSFDNLGDLDIYVSGSGNIDLAATANSMKTNISGSGNISLKGASTYQEVKISGSGDVKAFNLIVDETSVSISGSGECELNVSKKLEVRIFGSGDVTYLGDANVKSKISGSGDVKKKS